MKEQDQIGKVSSETSSHTSIRNSSNISTKLLSGVRVGSRFIASVVPTLNSVLEWASQLSTSAPSLRIFNRTGFHDLKNDPTIHSTITDSEETEKICL
uniref:UBX domain-containing protein n=1 Tax=Rodentolepis nana TaxID=102285 RepID=A0A0R3TZB2_RODNA